MCALLIGCATTPPDYTQSIQTYSCDNLAAELRFLKHEASNLHVLQQHHTVSQDVGAFIASIGTHAISDNQSLSGSADIDARLKRNTTKQAHIRKIIDEKC